MSGRLKGKIALISGGATGMGGAASRLFAAEGAKVGIVDRNVEAGRALAAEINQAGHTAMFAAADVSSAAEVNRAVGEVQAGLGAINVLFNHAGTIVIKPFLETTEEEWDWLTAVNVKSMYLMTRAVLPQMIAAGGGSIVCTSSISAVAATPMEVLYGTTKGACHMFARAIAVEFRDRNIRCNAVCPGMVDTDLWADEYRFISQMEGITVAEARHRAAQQIALRRQCSPDEVADVVAYLCSPAAGYISGVALPIAGGMAVGI